MRSAFTLIELLVVMVIIVLLSGIVISSLTPSLDDKVSESARIIQSRLDGARSRAVAEGRPVGLRFTSSNSDTRTPNQIQYVHRPDDIIGAGRMEFDQSSQTWILQNFNDGEWQRLNIGGRTLIQPGNRIELPRGSGSWYAVRGLSGNLIQIAGHYQLSQWDSASGYVAVPRDIQYRLELSISLMPNTDVASLPRGIVIDGDASQWDGGDVIFGANGSAGLGVLHFYITTAEDVELTRMRFPQHPANGGSLTAPVVPASFPIVPHTDPRVVSLFSASGATTSSQVNFTDVDGDEIADSPFNW